MNNTTLLFIFYLISIIFISIDIFLLIFKNKLNKDLIYVLFTTYILNISMCLFFFYFNNLVYSLFNSLILMVTSFLLIIDLKRTFNKTPILSIPYFIFTIFLFSNIVNQFLSVTHL